MLATYLLPIPIFLGKTYEITYVRLRFNSPRPASFAIYKKKRLNPAEPDPNPDQDWIPWQYYSGNSIVMYVDSDIHFAECINGKMPHTAQIWK